MCACLDVIVRPEPIEFPEGFGLTIVLDNDTWEGITVLDLVHVDKCVLVRIGGIGSGQVCIGIPPFEPARAVLRFCDRSK